MSDPQPSPEKRGFNWLLLIPPLVFAGLAGAFYLGLQREAPDELPSALAGRTAPSIELPALDPAYPAPAADALTQPGLKLVNFWASWCAPCRIEHPVLMDLAQAGIPIIGVNYKDQRGNAVGFIEELGNPYTAIGFDESGRRGIDWGLYGVPETFIIDENGTVLLRFPGPVTPEIYETRFQPILGIPLGPEG